MNSSKEPENIPDIILIVGIDAAGKDHLAKVAQRLIREKGGCVEKRQHMEDILVWLTRQFLGAQHIENKDLPEKELRRLIVRG